MPIYRLLYYMGITISLLSCFFFALGLPSLAGDISPSTVLSGYFLLLSIPASVVGGVFLWLAKRSGIALLGWLNYLYVFAGLIFLSSLLLLAIILYTRLAVS